jgi:hypothetical protein
MQLGVEILESHSDKRYKYFNNKIQALMKQKHIIEELHFASTGTKPSKLIMGELKKMEGEERKSQHHIQMMLNSDQYDQKKIQEILEKE